MIDVTFYSNNDSNRRTNETVRSRVISGKETIIINNNFVMYLPEGSYGLILFQKYKWAKSGNGPVIGLSCTRFTLGPILSAFEGSQLDPSDD